MSINETAISEHPNLESWKPGQSGNLNGRPWVEAMLADLEEQAAFPGVAHA